jgi:hypothetical protein
MTNSSTEPLSDEQLSVHLLFAPTGQLSGDGQLRELMNEQRSHVQSDDGGIWYLSPEQTSNQLGSHNKEALAIKEPSKALWLQLRFGGQLDTVLLNSHWLHSHALSLPPQAPLAKIGLV